MDGITPPPSLAFNSLLFLCLKTLLLPPFGLYWGYLYLRQPDKNSKIVGLLTVIVTIVETVWLTFYTLNLVNTVNQQLNLQLNSYGL
jgi:hypothetical protein